MTTQYLLGHQPVLLSEVLLGLNIKSNGMYVDATFGRGGHSKAILEALDSHGRLFAFDKDPTAIDVGLELAASDPRFQIHRSSFANLKSELEQHKVGSEIDGVLMDLGVSSPQLDDPKRGFSFQKEGPLDMRMDPDSQLSAAIWVNEADFETIRYVLREYGEERYAKRIANAIIAARQLSPITTTTQLAKIVADANVSREKNKHPATRSFQAIRIFINQELEDLTAGLAAAYDILKPGGRLVVMSFHSLEDRIVKKFINKHAKGEPLPKEIPVTYDYYQPSMLALGKPRRADPIEINNNPRARSVVLRIAQKVL